MARYANPYPNGPYPTNPSFGIAAESIARALFGDPQARAEQEQQQAEMDRIQAATGYDLSRTRGLDIQNTASAGLPALLASLAMPKPQPQQQVELVTEPEPFTKIVNGEWTIPSLEAGYDPELPQGITVDGVQPVDYNEQLRAVLPGLIASMGQMQGDKIDPAQIVGTLASMFGDDGMARRGMVAQGKTPDKDFALDMDRADEIAQLGYDADHKTKTGVATINHASDIPVANIRAGATVKAAQIGADGRVTVAGVNNDGAMDRTVYKEGGTPVADGRAAAMGVYPGLKITQNERDPNSKLGKANPGSWHNKSKAAVDARKIPGMTFEQYVQGYRDAGYSIIEARDEYKNPAKHATGPHWHVVLGGKGGASKSAAKPKAAKPMAVSATVQKSLMAGVDGIMKEMFTDASPRSKRRVLALATKYFQENGNVADALVRAENALRASHNNNKAAKKKKTGWSIEAVK